MKIGLIDVGGGLRGIYGAGVMDYMMRHGIRVDYCIGVSAGAANIVSYMAGQEGRNYVYYTKYSFRRQYMSFDQLIRKKSYINLDYIYGTLSNSGGEYPLDYAAICESGIEYRIVATDAWTGEPVYFTEKDVSQDHYDAVMASCCVPVVNQPRALGDREYFDGGISDPIPIRKAFSDGCDKVIVVLTRPRDFVRVPKTDSRFARILKRHYPKAAHKLRNRAYIYNEQLEYAKWCEGQGKAVVIAPQNIFNLDTLTKDRESLIRLYIEGYQDAAAIPDYLDRMIVPFRKS